MEIPHKSRQKKGWLYWDFYDGKESATAFDNFLYISTNVIRIFVKGKSVAMVSELVYRDRWKNVRNFDSIEIMENENEYPFNSILADIKKNLFLTGHFLFFGWEKEMAVKMPPPGIIQIPVFQNKSYDASNGIEPFSFQPPLQLEYRLKNTDVNNAYYKLASNVSIKVE